MHNNVHGFHLIELLIVMTIISLLSVIALPLYTQHIVHEKRLEAANTLMKLAVAMEHYHLEHNTYQGATLSKLQFPETIANHQYQLIIQSATSYDYQLVAKPFDDQAKKDKRCGDLLLQATGEKTIDGKGNSAECWS